MYQKALHCKGKEYNGRTFNENGIYKMTIKTIEATINAQIADLEEAWRSNIKNNDQDRIKSCEFAIIELNILLNTFKQAA